MSNILFVVDISITPSKLQIIKKLLNRFVIQKFLLQPNHFGILTIGSTVNWHLLLSSVQPEIHLAIDQIESAANTTIDADWPSELLTMINGITDAQIILVYGQKVGPNIDSKQVTNFYKQNPKSCIDLVFLHDKLFETNQDDIQNVYLGLQKLLCDNSKKAELYKNVGKLMMIFTELLAKPEQRRPDIDFYWKF